MGLIKNTTNLSESPIFKVVFREYLEIRCKYFNLLILGLINYRDRVIKGQYELCERGFYENFTIVF